MPCRVAAAFALTALAGASPAAATWLHCTAEGKDSTGTVAFHTTAVDVGPLPANRLNQFRQELLAKVAKVDPDAKNVQAVCTGQSDQVLANSQYSHALEKTTRRLGWEHVTVLAPDDWMQDGEVVADPSRP